MSALSFADLLDVLGHNGGYLSVCQQTPGGTFNSQVVTAHDAALMAIEPDRDNWFGVNPLAGPLDHGRGGTDDVTHLASLYADLDAKDTGVRDFATAHIVVDDISGMLGTRPMAMTLSGHGLQPYWPIDGVVAGLDAVALLRRFGRLVRHVAGLHNGHVDSVFDLARVLRVPGSVNHKAEPVAVMCLKDVGHRLELKEIDEALLAYGIPETPEDRETLSDVLVAPGTWTWAERTCGYVAAMVTGWGTNTPTARHPWLVSQATRLAAAHRCGCLTEADHATALTALAARFRLLLAGGDVRRETPGEITEALSWGIDRIAAKTDEATMHELGDHKHADVLQLLPGAQPMPGDRRPVVDASSQPELNVGNAASMANWLRDNVGAGPLAGMFIRGHDIVHTPREGQDGYIPLTEDGHDDDGPAQVRVIKKSTLASRVQYAYECVKYVKRDKDWVKTPAMFPVDAARVATDVPEELVSLRRLKGVVHSPVMRADGTILAAPGYDTATGLLHLPEPGLCIPPIPDQPTPANISDAVGLLEEMTAGFNFVTDDDRANYYGILLTPLLRTMTPPPYRLAAISSPQPGSGKTLLATMARIIHGGVFRSEMPEDDAELRKQLTAMLTVTTGPIIHFDNVSGVLRSSTMAGLLTSATWGDRPLGATEWVGLPNDRLWMITGNNLLLGGDLLRRSLWVTIDPGVPHPECRTGFAIDNLERWVSERRGDLLHALLTLIRAWVAAGRPSVESRGSDVYAEWIDTVTAILKHAGVPGLFASGATSRQEVGVDDDEWSEFLAAVHDEFGDRPWTVKEMLAKVDSTTRHDLWAERSDQPIPFSALPADLQDRAARAAGIPGIAKTLGHWLRNREGRWAGKYAVRFVGEHDHRQRWWRVEQAEVIQHAAERGDKG